MKWILRIFATLMFGGAGAAFFFQAITAEGMGLGNRIGLGAVTVIICGLGLLITWKPDILQRLGRK